MSSKAKTITAISVVGIIALFCTDFLYMADLGFYPSFGVLMGEFYEFDPATGADNMALLNFCMTGSQLAAMVSSFAVIPLMRRFSKKSILLVEIVIFAVCSLCAPLVADLTYVTVMRTLSGFGFGGVLTVAIALIQQVYRNNKKRRDMLVGWQNGMLGATGAINSLAGGFLAAISWNAIYNIYWIAVVVFVLVLFFVPKTPADKDDPEAIAEAEAMAAAGGEEVKGWNGTFPKVLAVTLAYMFVNIVYLGMGSGQISLYIPELGIGGEVETGIATMCGNLSAVVCGIIFAPVFHKCKRFLPTVFYAVMTIGLIIYSLQPHSLALISLGFFLAAFAYSFGLSYYMVYAGDSVPPSKISTAIAMVIIGMTLGAFISPYVVTFMQGVLGCPLLDPVMGAYALAPIYPYFTAAVAVACVLSIILGIRSKKRGEVYGETEPVEE